ncbi:MAG TPA: PfkB family carbohydrate kinase [Terriglobia bacterium]|nr:PfkB family carbohydrate kinase [Terriglobia bacterium]
MSVLVVGSVAFDSIRTPSGHEENILGGSATYFSLTASFFTPVNVVAVVGEDFTEEHQRVFQGRTIHTAGIEHAPGRTFRWSGEYTENMNEAKTLDTQLNVFEHFSPKIPPAYLDSQVVFLGNIHPSLQLHVREQMPSAQLVALDTMNFWIKTTPDELKKTLTKVDLLMANEGEAYMLSGCHNIRKAAACIQKLGPRMVVIKRGEYGVIMFMNDLMFSVPAYPLEEVHDPTGAGDSFAGGFVGYLGRAAEFSETHLRRAMVYGSVMASFTVEDFGLKRILRLTPGEIDTRFREFKTLTHFDV